MLTRSYAKGSVTGLIIRFTDPTTSALVDPSAVFFTWRIGEGSATTWTYTVNGELIRQSAGTYRATVDDAVVGVYRYRAFSTGTYQAAIEGQFIVESQF